MKNPSLEKIDEALKYLNSWPIGLRDSQYERLDELHYAATQYLKNQRKNHDGQ